VASVRVLVTRPAHDAAEWVRRLSELGIAAEALPLIDIAPEPPSPALRAARQHLADYDAAMFVSGNAVTHFKLGSDQLFFEKKPGVAQLDQARAAIKTRAWSPGPGTTAALLRAGWPAARIDAPAPDAGQFDSEALWARVAPQVHAGVRVLLVRGGDVEGRAAGRDWLRERLAEAGAQVDTVVVYRRRAPVLDGAQAQRARAATADGTIWLFSSAEAIANLRQCLADVDWRAARALATHPRIGAAARAAGFGVVLDTRPSLDEVRASIESLA